MIAISDKDFARFQRFIFDAAGISIVAGKKEFVAARVGRRIAELGLGSYDEYLNLVSGILHIDKKLVEVGRVFGLEGWGLITRVLLPATLPSYLVGLRSGLGLAWMFVVAAEIMGASRGLGFLMVDGQATSRPELILATLLLFAVLGKGTDRVLEAVSARWLHWRTS